METQWWERYGPDRVQEDWDNGKVFYVFAAKDDRHLHVVGLTLSSGGALGLADQTSSVAIAIMTESEVALEPEAQALVARRPDRATFMAVENELWVEHLANEAIEEASGLS
jgi:hypothetical protein